MTNPIHQFKYSGRFRLPSGWEIRNGVIFDPDGYIVGEFKAKSLSAIPDFTKDMCECKMTPDVLSIQDMEQKANKVKADEYDALMDKGVFMSYEDMDYYKNTIAMQTKEIVRLNALVGHIHALSSPDSN